ncbi:hypothetical protein KCU77_g7674, partial [Aureobasidium melanogenum]
DDEDVPKNDWNLHTPRLVVACTPKPYTFCPVAIHSNLAVVTAAAHFVTALIRSH